MGDGTIRLPGGFGAANANDQWKSGFGSWFWGAVLAATVVHYAILAFWPEMTAADVSVSATEMVQVDVVPDVDIPPPPEEIQRPAIPMISTDLTISDEITIAELRFDDAPALVPEPPRQRAADSDAPAFTPTEVRPRISNVSELVAQLERRYPAMLKNAGITGTTRMAVLLDERGQVVETRVYVSSGYEQFDDVAQELVREVAEFSPAMNRDRAVSVWIELPIAFELTR